MSYILDALKKAERERQRPRVPTLATIHVVSSSKRRPLLWGILAAALVVNVAVLAVVLHSRQPRDIAAPIAVAPDAVASAPPAARESAPDTPPAPPSPTIERPRPTVSASATRTVRPAPSTESVAPSRSEPFRASAPAPAPESTTTQAVSPRDLKLEVLIYSREPAERAAYINGRRYAEGERVGDRLVVERIVEDGVVLRGDGGRFMLKQ